MDLWLFKLEIDGWIMDGSIILQIGDGWMDGSMVVQIGDGGWVYGCTNWR